MLRNGTSSSHQDTNLLYEGRTAAHTLDIVVVGCGLGGLAAAFALGRAGHNVTIVEAAAAIGEVGAGIQVSPNVSRVLRDFGLADRLKADAVEPMGIMFRRYNDGELVGRTDWRNMEKLYGSPYYHVHRADLHKMLSDVALSLPNVQLRLGTTVLSYTSPDNFLNGAPGTSSPTSSQQETISADLIIGADGVKSVLRGVVVGAPDQAKPTGDAAYRAIIPAEKLLEHDDLREFVEYPHMAAWMGPGRHLWHTASYRSRKEYNLVLIHPDDGSVESWTAAGSADKMRADFAGWEPRVDKLLSFVPSTLKWKLMDRQPLAAWIHPDERLVLLGDACHQCAAMAIEDGAVIGALFARLQNASQVPVLLNAYVELRHARTAEVQSSSRLNQHIFHLPDGEQQRERDDAMRETLVGAPGGGYPPAVLAAQRGAQPNFAAGNPNVAAALDATGVVQASVLRDSTATATGGGGNQPEYVGNPNQWADAQKSRALFGYDSLYDAHAWLQRNGMETPAPTSKL
ncbi:FAD/NAD(P)-binding domain-containing protein [Auriculariales sp. MPI-PUGE-AT-0066]|nr:FAD/NAD(P)-binding domain-containing protein [Auriculariales sp. MPI-PUGE-AT-0066]